MFVRSVEKILPPTISGVPSPQEPEEEGEEGHAEPESVKVLEGNTTFDHLMVWGHEVLPAADDPFVKGAEEWIAFAEAVSRLPARYVYSRSGLIRW